MALFTLNLLEGSGRRGGGERERDGRKGEEGEENGNENKGGNGNGNDESEMREKRLGD